MQSVGTGLLESRRGFLFGTILVFAATFFWTLVAGVRGIAEGMEYLALAGSREQVFLVHAREQWL